MENIRPYWMNSFIPMIILAPNLLWFLYPPINIPAPDEIKEPIVLTILENIGRVGVIIIPLFYPIIMDSTSLYCLIAMLVSLLIYYLGWFRFYFKGRNYHNLFFPLRWIPIHIPMAVSPVMYFVMSSILLKSMLMFMAAVVFGIGHILISYREYQRIEAIFE